MHDNMYYKLSCISVSAIFNVIVQRWQVGYSKALIVSTKQQFQYFASDRDATIRGGFREHCLLHPLHSTLLDWFLNDFDLLQISLYDFIQYVCVFVWRGRGVSAFLLQYCGTIPLCSYRNAHITLLNLQVFILILAFAEYLFCSILQN